MSYQALYRTYRPKQFKDIVGQDVIVKTLQQSIKNNKISHAYLFSGPRGTGKTSIARILAKAINCEFSQNGESCQQCAPCLDITNGNHPDVIEIDAASNNGVDEIRDLREKVKFLPGQLKYKVYIIDEVHMLSQGAFNALLKTLEEPPKHAVFILATTEPQKIPATILSRCQRFDFKALNVNVITKRLKDVIAEEDIKITDEAITTISENAEGGMRDALSILDQAISFSDTTISVDDVNAITGAVSTDKIIELANNFEESSITEVLKNVNELLDLGKESSKLVNNLLQFYRDCLLYKNTDTKIFNKYIFEKDSFKSLAEKITEEKIFYYVNILSDVASKIKFSNNPRIFLEVAFIRMVNMEYNDLQMERRVEELEQKIESLALNIAGSELRIGGDYDNEKVSVLEMKLNKVIHELSKLELHTLAQKVNILEEKINNQSSSDSESRSLVDENQLSNLMIEINELKSSFQELKTQNIPVIENTVTYFEDEITKLNQQLNSLLMNETSNKHNDSIDNSEFKLINDKLDDLEDKLYKLISGTLQAQQSAVFGKTNKRTTQQIALFGNQVVNYEDIDENLDEEQEAERSTDSNDKKDDLKEEVINPIKYEDTTEKAEAQVIEHSIFDTTLEEDASANEEVHIEISEPIVDEIVKVKEDNVIAASENFNKKDSTPKQQEMNQSSQVEVSSTVSGDVKNISEASVSYEPAPKVPRPSGAYTTYDVRIIEKILHDSRTPEARSNRENILSQWKYIDQGIEPSLIGTAEILKEGIVGVVGNKQIILVFDDATTVNQVMRPRFKRLAQRIFEKCLSVDVNYYMALPKETWNEKRTEYINQYNIGIKYPTLQPINNPELYEIEPEDDYIDERQRTIDKTIEIFGEELVKVE